MATYTTTSWVNGTSPSLSATNLLNIETGIEDAHNGATNALEHIVFAIPENYAGIDPTGTSDCASALSSAFTDALGKTLVIPPGTYRVDSRVTVTMDDGDDLHVIADGAQFVCYSTSTTSGRLFRFENTTDTAKTVSAVAESVTTGTPYANQDIQITTLTCSGVTGIAVGDWVRIYADDVVTGPDVNVRSGQWATVVDISGSDVIVAGHLRDAFTTTVKLARAATPKLTWRGGEFTDSAAIWATTTGAGECIEARLLIRPEFSHMYFHQMNGPGIRFRRCYQWLADDLEFLDLKDDGTCYGYGINDDSEFGLASRLKATRVRHAYTTSAATASAGGTIETFGRAYGTRVVDSVAVDTSSAAWDTHGDAWGIQFINCDAHNCQSHTKFRGLYNVVRGGLATGQNQGGVVLVNDTSSGGESYGHDISGLTIQGATYRIFDVTHNTYGPSSNPSYFHDCIILDRDTTDPIFYANNSTLHHARIAVAAGGTRTGTAGTATIAVMTEASDTA